MLSTTSSQNDENRKSVSLGTLLILLALIAGLTAIFVAIHDLRLSEPTITKGKVAQTTYGEPPIFLYSIYGNPASPLRSPMGVYADKRGQIYVASTNSHQVQVFSDTGKFSFSFGSQGSGPGQFSFPYGISGLENGNLLVAETGNGRIQEFTPGGRYIGQWAGKEGSVRVEKPGPLTISGDVLYIGDLVAQVVKSVNLKSGEQQIIAQQFYPHGLGLDTKGNVYVANSGTYSINIFDPKGKLTQTIPKPGGESAFSLLRGLALDNLDRVYAVDSLLCQVKVFNTRGQLLFTFGGKGFEDGQLFYPTGIFVDGNNRICVADWGNNRVCVWGYPGLEE